MSTVQKRTFSLPAEHASFIDRLVDSGAYASGSEVIRAGLRALQERDAAVERWLKEEAATAYDDWKTGKAKTLTADEAFDGVWKLHAERTRGKQ
jgi:antitoxin ParD1/3/4